MSKPCLLLLAVLPWCSWWTAYPSTGPVKVWVCFPDTRPTPTPAPTPANRKSARALSSVNIKGEQNDYNIHQEKRDKGHVAF